MVLEISLLQMSFCTKFRFPKRNSVVPGTKCHAKFHMSAQNFNNIRTIDALKYGWTFAFLQISHNFSKFRWNSLSLPLHSTVTGYSCGAGCRGIPHKCLGRSLPGMMNSKSESVRLPVIYFLWAETLLALHKKSRLLDNIAKKIETVKFVKNYCETCIFWRAIHHPSNYFDIQTVPQHNDWIPQLLPSSNFSDSSFIAKNWLGVPWWCTVLVFDQVMYQYYCQSLLAYDCWQKWIVR